MNQPASPFERSVGRITGKRCWSAPDAAGLRTMFEIQPDDAQWIVTAVFLEIERDHSIIKDPVIDEVTATFS